ncbi:malto-oligosyltrehalose trehalohydrolase [Homoserinibacter sp. YIM 151385]|uniref:malto-oligosyltrehalose trehalohydrolase n=1 Tax=Homoserinibacter sp. YIM 151385 TaxID=2985506 RepID=UPI0022F0ADAC|nr:malto-oligosyltrehalose trehalohydrolase [Homoserinibacter sp. YIM 151385]WBU36970.1 malto-oligosyltrehalose trehalohydrolase [Homoserinibacter sp. YIM 151385]
MSSSVWAPAAERVRIRIDGHAHAMVSIGGGWWSGPEPRPGQRYGFLLDDDETALPDPRGRRLPDGVHGESEATAPLPPTDAASTGWAGRPLERAVIYELHLGTYSPEGTLDGAAARLDHLVELGIDFVELLPVNGFNGTWNWGYDGVAWHTVHEGYGGPEAYRRFVDRAHALGLGVIQDVVYNHLGPSGNYLPRFGPYLVQGSRNTWGDTVNLASPEVRRYILDNAAMWLGEYGVDGLRLDAVHALVDDGPVHLLAELGAETDQLSARLGRPLHLIAESDLNDPVMFEARPEGYGLSGQWSDDYHHAVHVALTGETSGYYEDFADPEALGRVWSRGFFHDGTFSSFRGREHGRPVPAATEPWRLVEFSQDHDQIGNRAAGDRLTASLSPERLAVAAVLTVMAPGTPMLFMGEEWGARTPWQFFTSHPEPELGRATAEGRIAEFERMGWDPDAVPDPQDPATFERSKLDWAEPERPEHAALLDLYRRLIALRHELPAPARMDELTAEPGPRPGQWRLGRGAAHVLVNLAREPWDLGPVGELRLATVPGLDAGHLVLPADSAAVTD